MSSQQAATQLPLPPQDNDDDDVEGELQLPAQVLEAINNNLLAIQGAMVNMAQAVQAATAKGQAATAATNAATHAAAAAISPLPVQSAEKSSRSGRSFCQDSSWFRNSSSHGSEYQRWTQTIQRRRSFLISCY
jgi:cell division septation protein DedD